MKELGAGRASTVYALDEARVLRRGGAPVREARVMRHARAAGFPVPTVHEVQEDALVLERIHGPTMAADLRRSPWRLHAHARLLAALHERLHRIRYDDEALLHLDLHPENVLLPPTGPVVIDWTNARAGEPVLDVALSWVILKTSGGLPGRVFARAFLGACEQEQILQAVPDAAALRIADSSLTERERNAVRRLLR